MRFSSCLVGAVYLTCFGTISACELCAIYSANDARGDSSAGFLFSVSEQFVSFNTLQFEGEKVSNLNREYLDSSLTHVVPGYNFTKQAGISLSLPLVNRSFQRSEVRYSLDSPAVFYTEHGNVSGLGDVALIGRFTILDISRMKYGIVVNALGGVKFPTSDTERLKDEVDQTRIFEALLPPGTPHDPLGHSVSAVHQHELSPGSGSFDGIMGLTVNSHWRRWFLNGQFQYYWRTEGESSFQYGNQLMTSGGPGRYLLLNERFTFSLQANAAYESNARASVLGRKSDRTEMTAWFVGPQLLFTWGSRLSALAGADLPVRIENNGFQAVADYRLHGSLAWRF